MSIKIYDIENLPFGCQILIKTLNGVFKNAVVIIGKVAFEDGMITDFKNLEYEEVYLGWQ